MPTEYYIWKWADNDLCARPAEVVDQLLAGDLPAALHPFPVRHVYGRLVKLLEEYRAKLSELYVAQHPDGDGTARFIRLRHPLGNAALADKLLHAVWEAELTVYDAQADRLIGLPKRNLVEMPDGNQLVDVDRSGLPALLHRLGKEHGLAALTCYDRDGNMFQVWSHQGRFAVEWQVLPARDFRHHRIWVAGRPIQTHRRARLGSVEGGLELLSRELLGMADVYSLWTSFLAGIPRPATHVWRDVTRQIDHPGQPPRHRHLETESAFPDDRFFGQN